jgi:hypothetical protein
LVLYSAAAHGSPPEGKTFAIALRIVDEKTMHFDDPAKAQQHAAAVKKLGAEMRLDQHEGHSDVTYRTVGWKLMEVETDELAHKWEDWLKGAGFETLHGHDPDHEEHAHHEGHEHDEGGEHAEVVLIRTGDWVSRHLDNQQEAADLVVLAKALRCEVQQANHGGHIDVRFHCPEWTAIDFPSHEAATAWAKWLQTSGFEVRHEHTEAAHANHDHTQHTP